MKRAGAPFLIVETVGGGARRKGFRRAVEGAEREALSAKVLLVVQPESAFTSNFERSADSTVCVALRSGTPEGGARKCAPEPFPPRAAAPPTP